MGNSPSGRLDVIAVREERTANLSKREKRALSIVLISLLVVSIAGYIAHECYIHTEQAASEEFKQSLRREYSMGEIIRLNKEEDEAVLDKNGFPWSAGFDWCGTLEVAVLEARLYSSCEDAGLSSENASPIVPNGCGVLLCDVRIQNIDAVPGETRNGDPWFLFFVFLPYCDDIDFFSGTPEGADLKDANRFDLPIGEEAVFQVAYVVEDGEDYSYLRLGTNDKYKVRLDVQDMRTEAA